MILWRKKTNPQANEQETRDDQLLHPTSDPNIEPAPHDDNVAVSLHLSHDLNPTESEIITDMVSIPLNQIDTNNKTMMLDRPLFPVSHIADLPPNDADTDTSATGGWLSRLTTGLAKSSIKMGQGLAGLITQKKLDAAALEKLEELLLSADLGPATTTKVINKIRDKVVDRDITDHELRQMIADEIEIILAPCARPLMIKRLENSYPFVMLICGVNGVGKTTTIGKMAKIMHDQKHHSVMMVAGDTFRAAAVEQLQIWGARAHTPVITRDIGADAAALAYESYTQAKRDGTEVMMIDTAGRLHNKTNLMAELEKIVRVLKKHDTTLPHEVILVLDGTTGQNAFAQVETFKEMVNVTGLIVTKLDGTAKGGVVVGLADRFGLPIYAVGVGEAAEDLNPFTAAGYAQAFVGL